ERRAPRRLGDSRPGTRPAPRAPLSLSLPAVWRHYLTRLSTVTSDSHTTWSPKALLYIEINNPHAEVRTCGYLARLVGPLRPRLLDGLALERRFAHTHHAVDLASLLHEQAFCHDVTVHDAGGLDLDALVGADTAAYFPTDDRLARNHVSFHLAALPHEHLPARADGTHHRAFRSEEHTSELQSRGHLVCRLLLEKKTPNRHRHT